MTDPISLVQKAKAGDLDAFTQIVNQFQHRIYAFALARLSNRADAEEIVQETWLKVFVHIRNLKNPGSLSGWIFQICDNCINLFLRKKARTIVVQGSDVEEIGSEVEEQNDWHGYADLIGLVIGRLKPRHRDVIELRYFCGLNYREIGAVLGIPVDLLKSRLHEARVKIRELLPGLDQDARLSQRQLDDLKEKIMGKLESVQRGADVVCRLSLEGQIRVFEAVSKGQRFDESLLQAIGKIDGGLEWIKECDARLQPSELADILAACDENTSRRILDRLDRLHNVLFEEVKQGMIVSDFTKEAADKSLVIRPQRVDSDPHCLILYLSGYIDLYNADNVGKRLFRFVEGGYIRLILHCGGFNYISSTGIGLFTELFKALKEKGGSLAILQMQPKVYEVFELLGLSRFLENKDSLEEALAHCKRESEREKPVIGPQKRIDKADVGFMQHTASLDCEYLEVFGYHEKAGSGNASGDYFNFQRLDDEHVALIKSDVSGKGSPTYQVMAGITANYLKFFKDWPAGKGGVQLEKLIYSVNDFIEQHGAKGRFAALIVMVINIRTGECRLCHAGDSQLTLFDGKRAHTLMLPEKPVAGIFPSGILKMHNGYEQVTLQLDPGGAVLLFTDGLPESRRTFRDSSFHPVTCDFVNEEGGNAHGSSHCIGWDSEEFGLSRVNEVVSAAMSRNAYRLIRYHNPLGDEDLVFDFGTSEGTARESVLALTAVQKVFRLCPDPASGAKDTISLDPSVHDSLRKHWKQFERYFSFPAGGDENALVYSHLKEDPQYDDIAVLCARRR